MKALGPLIFILTLFNIEYLPIKSGFDMQFIWGNIIDYITLVCYALDMIISHHKNYLCYQSYINLQLV